MEHVARRATPASSSSGSKSGATPRSDAIERSPSSPTIDTTTPSTPAPTGPTSSTPCPASSRATSSPAASSPRFARQRASAPSDAAQAATFAAWPPAPVRVARANVVAGSERLVEPDDHVEHHVAEGHDPHSYNRPMDGEAKRGRARSFLLGGLVGASAAIATARRRRDVARRRRDRRLHPAGPRGVRGRALFPGAARGRSRSGGSVASSTDADLRIPLSRGAHVRAVPVDDCARAREMRRLRRLAARDRPLSRSRSTTRARASTRPTTARARSKDGGGEAKPSAAKTDSKPADSKPSESEPSSSTSSD